MKKFFKRLGLFVAIIIFGFIAYFVYFFYDVTSISKGDPIPDYGNNKTAILVIDVQEGYTGKYASNDVYNHQSGDLIVSLNQVISYAREANVEVVYIQQHITNNLINWLDGGMMAPGTPAVAVDKRVKKVSMHQFKKNKSDAFSSEELETFLRKMEINTLVITGLDMAQCAFRTSVAALNRGYNVMVVKEAVISENDELKNEKLEEIKKLGAKVVSVNDLPAMFEN